MTTEALAREFSEHRSHLIAVGYRLTSSLADAEDAVQESWLRLAALDATARTGIRDLRAWLTTVVGRICLDRLKSATARRERYVGSWLPEPLVTPLPGQAGEDPLDAVVRDDGVRMAALIVLDKLSPEHRLAFVLHDAFGLPFAEIGDILGCGQDTARQYASRGRRAVADADPPPRATLAEQQAVLGRFMSALATGDVSAVIEVLAPEAVVIGDGGGKARTSRRVVEGADKVARFAIGLLARYDPKALSAAKFVMVNGDLGFTLPALPGDGQYLPLDRRVTAMTVRDGRVVAIYDVANPDKLSHVPEPGTEPGTPHRT